MPAYGNKLASNVHLWLPITAKAGIGDLCADAAAERRSAGCAARRTPCGGYGQRDRPLADGTAHGTADNFCTSAQIRRLVCVVAPHPSLPRWKQRLRKGRRRAFLLNLIHPRSRQRRDRGGLRPPTRPTRVRTCVRRAYWVCLCFCVCTAGSGLCNHKLSCRTIIYSMVTITSLRRMNGGVQGGL